MDAGSTEPEMATVMDQRVRLRAPTRRHALVRISVQVARAQVQSIRPLAQCQLLIFWKSEVENGDNV